MISWKETSGTDALTEMLWRCYQTEKQALAPGSSKRTFEGWRAVGGFLQGKIFAAARRMGKVTGEEAGSQKCRRYGMGGAAMVGNSAAELLLSPKTKRLRRKGWARSQGAAIQILRKMFSEGW